MKDAFGKNLKIGDTIVYSIKNSYGTSYMVGEILSLRDGPDGLDKVQVKITYNNRGNPLPERPVFVYTSYTIKVTEGFPNEVVNN